MERKTRQALDFFNDYLKRSGLRMTSQREDVVTTFLESTGHLSADELYALVRTRNPRIGFTTVFRTLKSMTDCGLARETDLNDGRIRYEQLYLRPAHHHLVCDQCGHTIEFFSPELEALEARIFAAYRFKPLRHHVQMSGICAGCQSERGLKEEDWDADVVFARDALQIAMETEQRGIDFYSAAISSCRQQSTKRAFERILREEEQHLGNLQEQWNSLLENNPDLLRAPVFLHFDFEALQRLFPSREKIATTLNREITARDALQLAIDMETEAHHFFKEYAEKFSDTRGRDIFLRFADEERDHYRIMREELQRLE